MHSIQSAGHSSRRAAVGSRLAARHAGSHEAMAAIRKKIKAMLMKVAGSVGLTPTSMVVIARVRAKAAIRPAETPIAVRRSLTLPMHSRDLGRPGSGPTGVNRPL